jgi:hypothetical protein
VAKREQQIKLKKLVKLINKARRKTDKTNTKRQLSLLAMPVPS